MPETTLEQRMTVLEEGCNRLVPKKSRGSRHESANVAG